MAVWIKMPLGREVGLSPSDIVLDGDSAPLSERARSPQFSARLYCGQTAGWIKVPLGRQAGLSQSDIVLPPPSFPFFLLLTALGGFRMLPVLQRLGMLTVSSL